MKRLLAALLVLASACSKDSTGPSIPNVAGSWNADWNFTVNGVNCHMAGGLPLSLNQTGTSFSGQFASGTFACTDGSSATFSNGTVVNGNLNGNTVTFDLDTPDQHQTGTITGSTMSGNATWRYTDPTTGAVQTKFGTWGASR